LCFRVVQLNENKLVEMCQVNEYVPTKDVKELYDLYNDGNCIDEVVFHQILLGGYQLRGSAAICSDHVLSTCTRRNHLEGLLPVVEDLHAEQCLLGNLYSRIK